MSTLPLTPTRVRLAPRPLIMVGTCLLFLLIFWVGSRYPQLIKKSHHAGQPVATMAYGSEAFPVAADAPVWQKIVLGSVNWLDSMKIGMTFGILFGALLQTILRSYPLKVGKNLYINSLKGAMLGVPMGVCVNCAVPTACGLTRGKGNIEVALGFLFSSPNFNPVVVAMTFAAFPPALVLTKYAILLAVILGIVPGLIGRMERRKTMAAIGLDPIPEAVAPPRPPDTDSFGTAFQEFATELGKNTWGLVKPTVTTMVLASLLASVLLVLVPWPSLLAHVTPLRMMLVSGLAVFMPTPIALDVMFAAHLQKLGVDSGYVMLFLTTLGTFSVLPALYLWREVSKPLAVGLFAFFWIVGSLVGLAF